MAYAAYYLCRMNLSGAQATICKELELDKAQIGAMIAAFSFVYGLGQLISGALCDRLGARFMLITGMIGSGLASIAFSWTTHITWMGAVWTLNGLFQSMGFAACVKTLANWFSLQQRGRVSGWFSLCYKVGNIVSLALTGWIAGYSWRWAFRVPAAAILLSAAWVVLRLREAPSPEEAKLLNAPRQTDEHSRLPLREAAKWVFSSGPLWITSLCCFSVAFTTYGFLNWLPHYWAETGSSPLGAGIKAACYPLGGCVGAIAVGWISDTLAGGKRAPVIAAALAGGGVLVAFLPFVPPGWTALRVCLVTSAGCLIMGGHAHVVTSVAMDVATARTAGTATGVINAMGYLGAGLTGLVSGWAADRWGWTPVFYGWAVTCCLGAGMISLLWHHRPAISEAEA